MAGLFLNCPLEANPDILEASHPVALRVAIAIMIKAGLRVRLPASIVDPTDEQLTNARRLVNTAQINGCAPLTKRAADCPVSNCASLTDANRRRNCIAIARVNTFTRAALAKLRNANDRVAYCGM